MMKERELSKNMVEKLKASIKVPFKELKLSEGISFIFFQIGADPYYIKVIG